MQRPEYRACVSFVVGETAQPIFKLVSSSTLNFVPFIFSPFPSNVWLRIYLILSAEGVTAQPRKNQYPFDGGTNVNRSFQNISRHGLVNSDAINGINDQFDPRDRSHAPPEILCTCACENWTEVESRCDKFHWQLLFWIGKRSGAS